MKQHELQGTEWWVRMRDHLIRREGVKLFPYNDQTGRILSPEGYEVTIGVGRNLEKKGIPLKIALELLDEDILEAIANLERGVFTEPQFRAFSEPRQLALTSMMFNLGHAGFLKFKNMIQAIYDGDWLTVSREALNSLWARQVGCEPGDEKRPTGGRAWEISELLRSGKYLGL